MDSPHDTRCRVGCPIRRFRDQRVLAPPPDFSQRATSFIASRRQGIHQMPFVHSPRSSSEPPLAQKAHFLSSRWQNHRLSRPTAKPSNLRLQRNTASTAKSKRSKNKHTMLGDRPCPDQHNSGEPPCPNPDRTNSCEQHRRTPLRHRGEPRTCPTIDRVARARPDLPLHDVQRTLTHPLPELRQPARTRASNGGITSRACHRTTLRERRPRWRAHAIGWWAWADLNSRPHAYQACALTN